MVFKLRLIGVAALLLAQMSLPVFANNLTATVVSVGDGDTIRVRTGNKTVTVRLACIDAPEMKQNPWGQQSSARLKQLLPVGQAITLRPVETDKYKRLVAEIYVGNRSINVNMVQEGQAIVYRLGQTHLKYKNPLIARVPTFLNLAYFFVKILIQQGFQK